MTINFFKGYASNDLFPTEAITASYQSVLKVDFHQFDDDRQNQHPLNYGTDPGNLSVRQTIVEFMHQFFSRTISDANCLNLTNGASFGIGMILNKCTAPDITQKIFIVSPCYYLINHTFVDFGYEDKLTSINETPHGDYEIDVQDLERQLSRFGEANPHFTIDPLKGEQRVYKHVIYIVPSYSNPGGLTYSLKTRHKLLDLARKYDMLIVCDDVYDLLNYNNDEILPRLVYLDRDSLPKDDEYGHVISNASTSKILAPGLRFGWHESVNSKLATQLSQEGCTKSGGTPSQLNSLVVADLMKSGKLNHIIDNYKSHYAHRAKVMIDCIKRDLPSDTEYFGGKGGYFVWVKFNKKYNIPLMIKDLAADGVILAGGNNFEVLHNLQHWDNCVRLCISFLWPDQITRGFEIWRDYFNNDKYII